MNIFNDFLSLLIKVAVVCLLVGLCLGFWLAQNGVADTTSATAASVVHLARRGRGLGGPPGPAAGTADPVPR